MERSTILRWIQKFSALLNDYAEKHKAEIGEFWHADETMQNVNGEHRWVWNVMDHETRYLLASRLSKSRDVTDARKPLAEARERAEAKPRVVFTDGLQSYHEAINQEFYEFNNPTLHVRVPGIRARINNNILERLNGTMRDRTKVLRAFDSSPTAQEVLDGFRFNYNHVRPHMGLKGMTPAQMAGFQVPDGPNLWMAFIASARRGKRGP